MPSDPLTQDPQTQNPLTPEQQARLARWDSAAGNFWLIGEPLWRWAIELARYVMNPDLRPYLRARARAEAPSARTTWIVGMGVAVALAVAGWLALR
jgi:hypothetical protein